MSRVAEQWVGSLGRWEEASESQEEAHGKLGACILARRPESMIISLIVTRLRLLWGCLL